MDKRLRSFCYRLISGQHPEGKVELLLEVIDAIVKFSGISRSGLARVISELAARYRLKDFRSKPCGHPNCRGKQ
jgi:hypothetical protein